MTKSKKVGVTKNEKTKKINPFEEAQLPVDQLKSVKGGNGEVVNDDTIIEDDVLGR